MSATENIENIENYEIVVIGSGEAQGVGKVV